MEKYDFSFIWLNWIQTFNLMFPKKSLKSLKVPKILRKMSFQIKVNNWGRCHNLGPWQVTWENFWGICSSWGLFFHVISIFYLHHGLYKIHMQKLFAYGKMIAYGKIKNGRKSLIKKKKRKNRKTDPRKGVPLCQEKKNSFVEVTSTGRAPHWCPDFKQRSCC